MHLSVQKNSIFELSRKHADFGTFLVVFGKDPNTGRVPRRYNTTRVDMVTSPSPSQQRAPVSPPSLCFAVSRSVLRCSMLLCVAVRCGVLQYVAVYCSVLQCVAVCCSPLISVWGGYDE